MQAVPKRTATKNSKGSKLFIRSVAAHMTHANRHVHPFVCDFTKKNKSIFCNEQKNKTRQNEKNIKKYSLKGQKVASEIDA